MNIRRRFFWLAVVALPLALGGCGRKDGQDSQVLARVDGVEITVHQMENALRVAKTQKRDPETRQRLLEQLIDRELAIRQASQMKLDERPEVMLRIEELKRDVLASTWGDGVKEASAAPVEADLRRYYADHPELFSGRRVYALEETVWPMLDETVRATSQSMKARPAEEMLVELRARNAPSKVQTVQRAAENLPLDVAARLFQSAASGTPVMFETPQVLMAFRPLSFQSAPLSFEAAEPKIRAFLTRSRANEALAEALAELRKGARIEYLAADPGPAQAVNPAR